ncbi:fucose mutarotase [Erethizon dorsatum]
MGHGDEMVLAHANFPMSSICRCGTVEIQADGQESESSCIPPDLGIPKLLEAVLKLLSLDTYVESLGAVMELVPNDKERGLQTSVWKDYEIFLLQVGCTHPGKDREI